MDVWCDKRTARSLDEFIQSCLARIVSFVCHELNVFIGLTNKHVLRKR